MWHVGDNDNEYGLKYGDEVKITPLEENNTELDCFLFELNNLRTGKRVEILESIEDMLNNYTTREYSVNEADIPEKPFKLDEVEIYAYFKITKSMPKKQVKLIENNKLFSTVKPDSDNISNMQQQMKGLE